MQIHRLRPSELHCRCYKLYSDSDVSSPHSDTPRGRVGPNGHGMTRAVLTASFDNAAHFLSLLSKLMAKNPKPRSIQFPPPWTPYCFWINTFTPGQASGPQRQGL